MTDNRLPRDQRAAQARAARRKSIMGAAIVLAHRNSYHTITREEVAAQADVAVGSVNHAFGTMDALRDAVMQEALATRQLRIIAQGIVNKHPIALAAPAEIREEAVKALA